MKSFVPKRGHQGFSRLDLLVVVGFIILLVGMLLPRLAVPRNKSDRIRCVNNLKNIGLSFRISASDHGDRLPWELAARAKDDGGTPQRALDFAIMLTNELSTPQLLYCPADRKDAVTSWEQAKVIRISYFFGLGSVGAATNSALATSFLAGDRNITNGLAMKRGVLELPSDRRAGWTHEMHDLHGNVVLGDGSVQMMSGGQLNDSIRALPGPAFRILVPE